MHTGKRNELMWMAAAFEQGFKRGQDRAAVDSLNLGQAKSKPPWVRLANESVPREFGGHLAGEYRRGLKDGYKP